MGVGGAPGGSPPEVGTEVGAPVVSIGGSLPTLELGAGGSGGGAVTVGLACSCWLKAVEGQSQQPETDSASSEMDKRHAHWGKSMRGVIPKPIVR